jgi:hypothetical protein
MKRLVSRISIFSLFLIGGCTTIDGGMAKYPENFSSGQHTFSYQYLGGFVLDADYPDYVSTYTGEWQNNRPSGRGTVTTNYGLSCQGEFGLPASTHFRDGISDTGSAASALLGTADDPRRETAHSLAKGTVFRNGTPIFTGYFENSFFNGEACAPAGEGVWLAGDLEIIGRFMTDVVGSRYGTISVAFYLGHDECSFFQKGAANGPRIFAGTCDAPHRQKDDYYFRIDDMDLSDPFVLAAGRGTLTEQDGTRYTGDFNGSAAKNGLFTITRPEQDDVLALFAADRLVMSHPAPAVLAAKGKECPGQPGFKVLKGLCRGNAWDGEINAYADNGINAIFGRFANGEPQGPIRFEILDSGSRIEGTMKRKGGNLDFIAAKWFVGGSLFYDGQMDNFRPHGKGICMHEGKPESCEYYHGERIDAIYKTRIENEKLRQQISEQQEAAAQRREERRQREQLEREQMLARQQDEGISNLAAAGMFLGMVANEYAAGMAQYQQQQIQAQQSGNSYISQAAMPHESHQAVEAYAAPTPSPAPWSGALPMTQALSTANAGAEQPMLPAEVDGNRVAANGLRIPQLERVDIQCENENGVHHGTDTVPVSSADCRSEALAERQIQCRSDWFNSAEHRAFMACLRGRGIADISDW